MRKQVITQNWDVKNETLVFPISSNQVSLSQSNIHLHFLIAESINISMYSLGVSSTPCCSSYFTQISKRAWYLSLSKRRLISYSFLSSILSFYGYSFINDTQYLAL